MAGEIASAYVDLLPSTAGFGSTAQRQLSPQMTTAGRTIGQQFGSQFGSSFGQQYSRDINGRLRDSRGRFVNEAALSGRLSGSRFGSLFGSSSVGQARGFGSRFGRVFASASLTPLRAIGVAAFGMFAVAKVKEFFAGAIDEARESQKVSALTAQVIKSTGGAAGVSAKQVGDLASAISRKVGIDDEAIQSGMNLLLTFKNVRNEAGRGNDIFNQASRAMVDMASAMAAASGGQVSFKSATTLVGKALNDPIKGLSALSRVGVTFTTQQQDQIKTLVASGKTTQAQKMILAELRSEFGGAAAASATAGDKFKVAFGNLQESVGTLLLPALDQAMTSGTGLIEFLMDRVPPAFAAFRSAVEPVTSAISTLVTNHLPVFKTILAALAGGVITSLIALIGGGLVSVLGLLLGALSSPIVVIGALAGAAIYAYTRFAGFREVVAQVVEWFQGTFVPGLLAVVDAVRGFAGQVAPIIQDAIGGLADRLAPLLPRVAALFGQIWATISSYLQLVGTVVKAALALLSWEWQQWGGAILDYVGSTFSNIVSAVSGVLNVLQGVIRLVLSLIRGDWSGAWDAVKQIASGAWQIIRALVSQAITQLQLVLSIGWSVIQAAASAAWEGIKKIPGLALAAIVAVIRTELGLAKAAVSAGIDAIKAYFGALASLPDKVTGWMGEILSAIKNKLGNAVDYVGKVPGKITSALGDVKDLLSDAGKAIMQSLYDGLLEKWGDVKDFVGGIAGWMKDNKGPIDYDRKLLGPAGRAIMEGFRDGLIEKWADVKSFVGGAGRQLAQELTAGLLAGIPGAVSAAEDAATKIQKAVLDRLTSMRDGVRSVLDGLRSEFASLRDSIASSLTGNLFEATDTYSFLLNLVNTKATLQKVAKGFHKLLKWGVSPKFLASLFNSGNIGLILDLASSSRLEALTASSVFSDIDQIGTSIGGQVAQVNLGPKIDRTNKQLSKIQKTLEALPDKFGEKVNSAASGKGTGSGKTP